MNTTTNETRSVHRDLIPTYVGAAIGFIAFIVIGAIPGMLYGGYMGLVMAGTILGTPIEPSIISKAMVGGGILLGLIATLFFFLVIGANLGALTGLLLRQVSGPPVEAPAEVEEVAAERPVPAAPAATTPPAARSAR